MLAFAILIATPVLGLRPTRGARLPTAKVPKPTNDTDPPLFRVAVTAPIVDSRARVAAALEISACAAIDSIQKKVSKPITRCQLKPKRNILDGFFTKFAGPNQCWRRAAKFVSNLPEP